MHLSYRFLQHNLYQRARFRFNNSPKTAIITTTADQKIIVNGFIVILNGFFFIVYNLNMPYKRKLDSLVIG